MIWQTNAVQGLTFSGFESYLSASGRKYFILVRSVKECGVGRAYSTYGGDEKYVQGFILKILIEVTTYET
jgi:hypothetical protein